MLYDVLWSIERFMYALQFMTCVQGVKYVKLDHFRKEYLSRKLIECFLLW